MTGFPGILNYFRHNEFLEQAKLQISALNAMAIIVLRHIYVSKQKALLEKHQSGIRVENSLD